MREIAPIVALAPKRHLPETAAEAYAMYAVRPPETAEELINLALIVQGELRKIQAILENVNAQLHAKYGSDTSGEGGNHASA